MDVFMLLCTSFVFLSIIEFFVVSVVIRSKKAQGNDDGDKKAESAKDAPLIDNRRNSGGGEAGMEKKDGEEVRGHPSGLPDLLTDEKIGLFFLAQLIIPDHFLNYILPSRYLQA